MNAKALAAIKDLLGVGGFIDDPAAMMPYLTSMRNRHVARSPLIALPSSTEQVAAIVKICRAHHLPIVPQGGNTGLVDGGIPSPRGDEVVVNLSRMNKVRELDSIGGVATVESGVVLKTLQDIAADAGFLFPLSMGSEGTMQIGGAIGTNAGGTGVLRYGTMRQLVLGVEAVLPDGSVISHLRKLPKDNTGYNLSQLLIGAEGTLGIVTAATLRLFPALRQTLTALIAVRDAEAVMNLFASFRREAGEHLTAFEFMSRAALDLVMRHQQGARFPCREDAPWYLLVECGASSPLIPLADLFEHVATEALNRGDALDVALASSSAQAEALWGLRHGIPESLRQETQRIHFDLAVPLGTIVDFLAAAEAQIHASAPDMVLIPFGHVGDGNIHYNMYATAPRGGPAFATLKRQIQDIVFSETERRQGSLSAEHGIGMERKAMLARFKSPSELDAMRRLKHALDPDGLMNPGKIFD